MIRKFLAEYKKTLKPVETEELFDLYIIRPISFLLVLLVKNISFSPNYYTLISMVTGVMTGFFFADGSYTGLVWGAVFLQITNVFDCADGQLARYKKITTQFGKILDGIADFVTYAAIYFGIAYHIYRFTDNGFIFLYAFISMLFMFIHIFYFDHFKNQFISFSVRDYIDKSEDITEIRTRYLKLKKKEDIKWILAFIFYGYTVLQQFFVNFAYNKDYKGYWTVSKDPVLFSNIKERYYTTMKFSVRLWTFFGASSHLFVFTLLALFSLPGFIFHFIAIVYNLLLIILIIYQKNRFTLLMKGIK
ncbi:MAG: CDP-alcohol phosphatidyltransferase family protein [Spirochaetes bacterium]|nr:CDP-alcohol phosphatidyltransferase family protein [Spirochaetota bacterium]